MFGSEKRKQEKQAERAAAEQNRIDYAAQREREKINAEREGKTPGALHNVQFIGEMLDEHAEKSGNKRVERAMKREGKKIKKEKNRKYWVLLFIIIALIGGLVLGYLFSNHLNDKADYKQAVKFVIAEEYDKAEILSEDLKYKDSENLYAYVKIRMNVKAYDGKMDKLLSELKAMEGFSDKKVNAQYNEFLAKVQPVGSLQKSINKIDVSKITLSDQKDLRKLSDRADSLKGKYSKYIDTTKLQDANKKLAVLEEASDKLQNANKQQNEETQQPEEASKTEEVIQ